MRLSDFLQAEVLDDNDVSIGRVQDVRLIQDGPVIGTWGAAFSIEGLIVSKRGVGARLGFHRSNVKGPLPLKALFEWIFRDARLVEWERIRSIEEGRIRFRGTYEDLKAPDPLSG
ncbi:MAG: hypothetical protein ABR548_11295 [Actinomycetota bacterium]|nr:hypothetical protein [Actinomycetota bacterium]